LDKVTIEVEGWSVTESRQIVGHVDPAERVTTILKRDNVELKIVETWGEHKVSINTGGKIQNLGFMNEDGVDDILRARCAQGDRTLAEEYFTMEQLSLAIEEAGQSRYFHDPIRGSR
jgi:hypothetical protein